MKHIILWFFLSISLSFALAASAQSEHPHGNFFESYKLIGIALSYTSMHEATNAAINVCEERTGEQHSETCRVISRFSENVCGAVARNQNEDELSDPHVGIGSDRGNAEEQAMSRCRESSGGDCSIILSDCNNGVGRVRTAMKSGQQ